MGLGRLIFFPLFFPFLGGWELGYGDSMGLFRGTSSGIQCQLCKKKKMLNIIWKYEKLNRERDRY